MAVKKTSGGDPLSDRVPERASGPSRSQVDDGGGSRCVSGKVIGCLGFSRRGVFIGEGAVSEVDQGGLTHRGRGQGLGRTALLCGQPMARVRLLFGLLEASLNNRRFGFVSSNSLNISCVTFPKHKNSRKQGTDTVASC
jgi:hypothetical protein